MYVLCYSELGIQGAVLYVIIIFSTLLLYRKIGREIEKLPPESRLDMIWFRFGTILSFISSMWGGITIGKLYAENTNWLIFVFPVCLWRAVQNAKEDAENAKNSEISHAEKI